MKALLIALPLLVLGGCATTEPVPAPTFPVAILNVAPVTAENPEFPVDLFQAGQTENEVIASIQELYGYAVAQKLRADVFENDSRAMRAKLAAAKKWLLLNQTNK